MTDLQRLLKDHQKADEKLVKELIQHVEDLEEGARAFIVAQTEKINQIRDTIKELSGSQG